MGLFGKKRGKFVDLSEGYSRPSPRVQTQKSSIRNDDNNSSLGFLGNLANSGSSTNSDVSWNNDSPTVQDYSEKKQKLTKRLLDMTDKIEDLSNQIYHLKQRIELLEKKLKINFQ